MKTHAISRFPVPDLAALPADLQKLFHDVSEKAGFVPNVFWALAHRPDELRAFFPAALVEFELLAAFHAQMAARPRISAYIGSRKQPVVFGMGLHGPKVDPAAEISDGDVFENPWREPIRLAPN